MAEYNTIKIRKDTYEMARKQAETEEQPIVEIISRAVDRYVHTRKDLKDRALLLIKLLDEEMNQRHQQIQNPKST
jgi:hypothetical protein